VLHTPFCDVFGLEFPILNAPMSGVAGADLAAAVSNAGGLGMIGGRVGTPGMSHADALRLEIRHCRTLTERPFGVGFISMPPSPGSTRPSVDQLQAAALDEGVTIIGHSFHVSAELFAEARRRGARIIAQIQTVAMAHEALAAGATVLVAQGNDGGGHVGSVGTMSFVPAIVDMAGETPVVAAGGIADGRGLAAAFMLGAQGASIGTRFMVSVEATTLDFWRTGVLSAATDDTIWTRAWELVNGSDFGPTVAGRFVKNAFSARWDGHDAEALANADHLRIQLDAARASGDASISPIWAGSAVGLVRDSEPAGAVVRDICAEAARVLRARTGTVLVDSRWPRSLA
jgi:nitronate monooxygenase